MLTRVLISIAPRSYRESLALALHHHHPSLEDVFVVAPRDLDGHIQQLEPGLVVCNEVSEGMRGNTSCWVKILFHNNLDAEVYLDGYSHSIEDISLADFLAIIDECSP